MNKLNIFTEKFFGNDYKCTNAILQKTNVCFYEKVLLETRITVLQKTKNLLYLSDF